MSKAGSTDNRIALISVRPRYAAALLEGSKTVEVRRRRARMASGALCLLYASSPRCALVGAIQVQTIDVAPPDVLWDRWGTETALNRHEFDEYVFGCSEASAIVVSAAVAFPEAITLAELRRRQTAFVTPQSYRFLAADEYASLLNGEGQHVAHLLTQG